MAGAIVGNEFKETSGRKLSAEKSERVRFGQYKATLGKVAEGD
jgi:hypothetical protein